MTRREIARRIRWYLRHADGVRVGGQRLEQLALQFPPDAGPWVVTKVGTRRRPYVLTRPPWFSIHA